jgi:hypothetical protein
MIWFNLSSFQAHSLKFERVRKEQLRQRVLHNGSVLAIVAQANYFELLVLFVHLYYHRLQSDHAPQIFVINNFVGFISFHVNHNDA